MFSENYNQKLFGIGSLACYDDFDQVGEGTYGYVYKARDKRNGLNVALKRLIFHRESSGFPLSAVREIKFLKGLQHKNIVQLQDVITSKGCEHLEVPIIQKLDHQKVDKERIEEQVEDKDKLLEQSIDILKCDDFNDNTSSSNQGHQIVSKVKVPWEPLKICGNLYLVFEFVEHDLGGLIDAKHKFSIKAIKTIIKQLFEVLEFLCEKKVLHRDIKCSNILISNKHHIKLADFGLARSALSSDGREFKTDMTNNVITMWYRPPELLLGAKRYSYAVDTWSAACVLAELELGRPLFPGRTEPEQLELISRVMGTPTETLWPGVTKLPNYESMLKSSKLPTIGFRGCYSGRLSEQSISFLERLLVLDPSRRSSAKVALAHKYFSVAPVAAADPATELEPLNPGGASFHEFKTKQLRKQREAQEQLAQSQAQGQKDDSTTANPTTAGNDVPPSSKDEESKGPKAPASLPPPPPLPFNVPPPPAYNLPHPPLLHPVAPPPVVMPLYQHLPFMPMAQQPPQPQQFFVHPMPPPMITTANPPHHFQPAQSQYIPMQPHPFPSDHSHHARGGGGMNNLAFTQHDFPQQQQQQQQQRGQNSRDYHHHHQGQSFGWNNRGNSHYSSSHNNNSNNSNSNTATNRNDGGSAQSNIIGNKRRLG